MRINHPATNTQWSSLRISKPKSTTRLMKPISLTGRSTDPIESARERLASTTRISMRNSSYKKRHISIQGGLESTRGIFSTWGGHLHKGRDEEPKLSSFFLILRSPLL